MKGGRLDRCSRRVCRFIISLAAGRWVTDLSSPHLLLLLHLLLLHLLLHQKPTSQTSSTNNSRPPASLQLSSPVFGAGHTERADLRPLGPDTGTTWRPLGSEVIIDGFDIQLPSEWAGTYQEARFKQLVRDLQGLIHEDWVGSGGVAGAPGDSGSQGEGVVYFGEVGGALRVRGEGNGREGWVEWSG